MTTKKINFTAPKISGLTCEAGKSQSIYWDAKTPNLGIRVTKGLSKSYIFETWFNGKSLRITIGDTQSWGLSEAQAEARRLKVLTDQSIDPRQVKAEAKAKDIASKQKSAPASIAWDEYIEYGTDRHKKPWSASHIQSMKTVVRKGGKEITRGLKKNMSNKQKDGILKPLIDLPLKDITAKQIEAWIKKEVKGRPAYTRRALALLSGFLNWASDEDKYSSFVPKRICEGLAEKYLKEPQTRDDCLEREQLKAWFAAIKKIGNPVISAYLQTLLLTGARRNEISGLKWKDIDTQWHKATIRDKMKGTREIPLSPYVEALIDSLPRRNAYVFSSPTAKGTHITEPRIAHNQALEVAGLPHLTLHGLRRSFKTLGVSYTTCSENLIDRIAGHKPQSISEKHYIRRPMSVLRDGLILIENFILGEAGIPIPKPEDGHKRLKVVNSK